MIPALKDRHFREVERAHSLYTRHVDPVLLQRSVELIEDEHLFPLGDREVVQIERYRYGTTHTTDQL